MVCIDILVLQAAKLAADTAVAVSVSDTAVAVVVESIVAVV